MTNLLTVEFFDRPEDGEPIDTIQSSADDNTLGKWCWHRLRRFANGRVEIRRLRGERPIPTIAQEFEWRRSVTLTPGEQELAGWALNLLADQCGQFKDDKTRDQALALVKKLVV